MKKLTTTQWLLVGGTVALLWMLYGKKKMNATQIKEEIQDDLSGTGGVKPALGVVPTPNSKECKERQLKWQEIAKTTRWASKEDMEKARKQVLGDCDMTSYAKPLTKSQPIKAVMTR